MSENFVGSRRSSPIWQILAWLAGIVGMIGIWLSVSLWLNAACLWMMIFAVLDITLMLRLTGLKPGAYRLAGVFSGTVLIVCASQWLIAAGAFGVVMGLQPVEAAQQIGSILVWEFTRLRIDSMDWLWMVASAFIMPLLNMRKK